jgi:hypothetical protein
MRAIDVACVTLSGCSQIDRELEHLLPSRDSVMHEDQSLRLDERNPEEGVGEDRTIR